MQSGMINKVAITKARLIDSKGMKHVTPPQNLELFMLINDIATKMQQKPQPKEIFTYLQ
jgi:hypothetical protein